MTTSPLPSWLTDSATVIPGVKALALGASGSGKTYLMTTLAQAGLTVIHIGLEPSRQTLAKAITSSKDVSFANYHYMEVETAPTSFAALKDTASKLNALTFKAICDLEGINRDKTRGFLKLLDLLGNIVIDGKSIGSADTLDNKYAIVIDSLSALSILAKQLIAGQNPALSPSQWNMAQDTVRTLLNKLCFECNCHVFVLGHLEPEKDEVTGKVVNMPSTLGRKLAPELSRYFDETFIVKGENGKHTIATLDSMAATKARLFPYSKELPATLVPLINEWRSVNNLK